MAISGAIILVPTAIVGQIPKYLTQMKHFSFPSPQMTSPRLLFSALKIWNARNLEFLQMI